MDDCGYTGNQHSSGLRKIAEDTITSLTSDKDLREFIETNRPQDRMACAYRRYFDAAAYSAADIEGRVEDQVDMEKRVLNNEMRNLGITLLTCRVYCSRKAAERWRQYSFTEVLVGTHLADLTDVMSTTQYSILAQCVAPFSFVEISGGFSTIAYFDHKVPDDSSSVVAGAMLYGRVMPLDYRNVVPSLPGIVPFRETPLAKADTDYDMDYFVGSCISNVRDFITDDSEKFNQWLYSQTEETLTAYTKRQPRRLPDGSVQRRRERIDRPNPDYKPEFPIKAWYKLVDYSVYGNLARSYLDSL
jgi:hypothetical protein